MTNQLEAQIEALIFCATEPISVGDLHAAILEYFKAEISLESVLEVLENLKQKYAVDSFSFGLFELAGGFQFLTKPAFEGVITILLKQKSKKKLSTSALETLSIIAYKQPITKAEIELIRGVNCDYAIQKLLEKELIILNGKADLPGRPILYATGKKFMEYFGINTLKDLPELREIISEENNIGQVTENA